MRRQCRFCCDRLDDVRHSPRMRSEASDRRQIRSIAVLTLLAVAFPSVNHQWFDGVPFDSPIEYLAIVIMLPAIFAAYSGRVLGRHIGTHRLRWIGWTAVG